MISVSQCFKEFVDFTAPISEHSVHETVDQVLNACGTARKRSRDGEDVVEELAQPERSPVPTVVFRHHAVFPRLSNDTRNTKLFDIRSTITKVKPLNCFVKAELLKKVRKHLANGKYGLAEFMDWSQIVSPQPSLLANYSWPLKKHFLQVLANDKSSGGQNSVEWIKVYSFAVQSNCISRIANQPQLHL
jgi:hypothetical protein